MAKIINPKDNLKELLTLKNETDESADLYFYGDIVSSWWGVWDDTDQYPESVKKFLENAAGKNINVHINSGGGAVFAGITIYNMLKHFDGYITVYVDGMAASIASVIAMAGDRIILRTGASLMVHKPSAVLFGGYNADELQQMAAQLDEIQKCIMQVYKEHKADGVELSKIEEAVNKETWLTSDEATELFNVEIETSMQAVACESEYIAKFLNCPPQYAQGKIMADIKTVKVEYEILNLGGPKSDIQRLR